MASAEATRVEQMGGAPAAAPEAVAEVAAPAAAAAAPAPAAPASAPAPVRLPAAALQWDARHFFNAEGVYCYCGQGRTYGEVALQCVGCEQWFHGRCISAQGIEHMVPLQRNYKFTCRDCARAGVSADGAGSEDVPERLELLETSWRAIAETAVLNLVLAEDGASFRAPESGARTDFVSIKDELVPWIERHWTALGHGRELGKLLDPKQGALDKAIFHPSVGSVFVHTNRTHVGVRFPERLPLTPLRLRSTDRLRVQQQALSQHTAAGSGASGEGTPGSEEGSGAGAKRPPPAAAAAAAPPPAKKGRRASEPKPARADSRRGRQRAPDAAIVPPHLVPENSRMVPVVRCSEMSHVVQDPSLVQLSLTHKASQLRVAKAAAGADATLAQGYAVASGFKGYRTVCATHAVGQGTWFFEVRVHADAAPHADATEREGHCRLGWATELATPDAPAGYDEHSYSFRSKAGTAFHQSEGRRFGASGYGPGDVVGCLIHLPQRSTLPRQRAQLSLKSGNYLIVDPELKRTDNEGSLLAFYVNGKLQGVPFTQLGREWFYPAISLFGEVTVSAHFGPAFLFPPTELPAGVTSYLPMSMAADAAEAEAGLAAKGGAAAAPAEPGGKAAALPVAVPQGQGPVEAAQASPSPHVGGEAAGAAEGASPAAESDGSASEQREAAPAAGEGSAACGAPSQSS